MKYYIYMLVTCLLSGLLVAPALASAPGSSINMPIPPSFQLSSVAKATDNGSGEFSPGPGKIAIIRGDHAMSIQVLTPARRGARLVSLDDYESGIVFRNNTMLLPLFSNGEKTGALVVATDNLTADDNGYAGTVTGLELDSTKITAVSNGMNFSAGAIMSLNDLPAGATYRVAFIDNVSLSEAVAADLEIFGQASAVATPPLDISSSPPAAGNMVSFVIVTIETEENWTGHYGDKNVTFYRYAGGELSRLRFSVMKSGNGAVAYQGISPGTGQFLIVAAAPRDMVTEPVTGVGIDIIMFGGILAVLLIALGVMVRRVTKR
jgi:hypothetical protein